jgi:hypothetical protein
MAKKPQADNNRNRRGRPAKFGRPSRVIGLTLPEDVLEGLKALHADPAWAIVQLLESSPGNTARSPRPRHAQEARQLAEFVHLPGGRALIVVQPKVFARLRGVSTIPLSDGRAFLAFDRAGGIADLEVAILDRLEEAPVQSLERAALEQARDTVRAWRKTSKLRFRSKFIIVVEGASANDRRPLAKLGRSAQPKGNRRR